jgi:two-component system response regulator FlrC
LLLRDLGSRNGSFVRGVRVEEAPLSVRDVIRVGEWVGLLVPPPSGSGASSSSTETFGMLAPGLYGGPRLREVLAPLERAAPSDLPIVIEGETGTGKEWTARAIHRWSGRQGPFVAVNCAALPDTLAEAELFGYRKGAFTGADRASPGYFRAAQGGTLLLDEIADLPLGLQSKLLRVLEQREVTPLGEATPVSVDVRILAAAQQSLHDAVREKRFRADLCARLDGLTSRLPSLRERVEDVTGLFRIKLEEYGVRSPELEWRLVERLCVYDWPFNVREVDLLARRLAVLHREEGLLRASHLPERFLSARPLDASLSASATTEAAADRDERDVRSLLEGLRRHGGNVSRAASDARISRQRAYRLMGARPEIEWRGERLDGAKEPERRRMPSEPEDA